MSIDEIGVTLLVGFIFIGVGLYGLKRGFSLWATKEQLWKSIQKWRVFSTPYPSPQMLEDIKRSWCYLRSMLVIGAGVGLLAMVVGMVAISLATTGTVDGGDSGDGIFFVPIFYFCFSVGCGLSGMFAVWRLRKTTKRQITYADLRRRRLSDYRSGFLRWLPLAILAETIAFSWFFTPHLGSMLRLLQSGSVPLDVPNSLWLISIIPCAIVVVSVLAELLMARIARLSRLLVTSDPEVSQRADDMLRAMVIGTVQAYVLLTVTLLGILQGNLIMRSLWASGYWQMGNRPYSIIADIFFLLLILTLGIGSVWIVTYDPFGGKVAGWPWQTKKGKQPEVKQ